MHSVRHPAHTSPLPPYTLNKAGKGPKKASIETVEHPKPQHYSCIYVKNTQLKLNYKSVWNVVQFSH